MCVFLLGAMGDEASRYDPAARRSPGRTWKIRLIGLPVNPRFEMEREAPKDDSTDRHEVAGAGQSFR
jgi:hypothetical protein